MRITNIYTALAASPNQMLAGAEGAQFLQPLFKSDAACGWLMAPGSCAEVSPLAGGVFFGFVVGLFCWFF